MPSDDRLGQIDRTVNESLAGSSLRKHPLTRSKRAYTLKRMYRTFDLTETRNCHCLAARRKAREITRMYEEKLRPHGLRATQFTILAALSQMGPTPISELADVLGLERTTLTRGAALLERNGWLDADQSAMDARERILHLTSTGLAKLEEAFPSWKEVQDRIDQDESHQSR